VLDIPHVPDVLDFGSYIGVFENLSSYKMILLFWNKLRFVGTAFFKKVGLTSEIRNIWNIVCFQRLTPKILEHVSEHLEQGFRSYKTVTRGV
jgi:hypothetical protein